MVSDRTHLQPIGDFIVELGYALNSVGENNNGLTWMKAILRRARLGQHSTFSIAPTALRNQGGLPAEPDTRLVKELP